MKKNIITTLDGSKTIQLIELDECYHSKMGAIQESYHVFIKNGFDLIKEKQTASILEIGFGTGLNAIITYIEASKTKQNIQYTALEAYPITLEEAIAMEYPSQLENFDTPKIFKILHTCPWETPTKLTSNFNFTKKLIFIQDFSSTSSFDLIYFDAFGYQVQPELWTEAIFKNMYNALTPNGILVTYAARGVIKRNMKSVGFTVKKVPGPPGKREMMLAFK